jgi:ubiquinone/menaquinone biosynthesis C-methylase UbiE
MTYTGTKNLKEYYGKILAGTHDLQTNACCTGEGGLTPTMKTILGTIDSEIRDRFYGCGSPLPPLLEGCTVVDLGCGTGRDVYLASALVGAQGRVIGIDMTEEQLEVARRHAKSQTKTFGFETPNVEFLTGYIEDLASLGMKDNSVDVVLSNCVINLSPDKPAVFQEIFRVLKPGGELLFSDVFSNRRIPKALFEDPLLHGECLSGAMYREDFRRLLREVGCLDFRMLSNSPIEIGNPEIARKLGSAGFTSSTIRAFKLPELEDICEDYGQVATYQGSIPDWPHFFDLDDHHRFFTQKPMLVCGNTAAMIQETRYAKHFQVQGDRSLHFGPFDCHPAGATTNDASGGACC